MPARNWKCQVLSALCFLVSSVTVNVDGLFEAKRTPMNLRWASGSRLVPIRPNPHFGWTVAPPPASWSGTAEPGAARREAGRADDGAVRRVGVDDGDVADREPGREQRRPCGVEAEADDARHELHRQRRGSRCRSASSSTIE